MSSKRIVRGSMPCRLAAGLMATGIFVSSVGVAAVARGGVDAESNTDGFNPAAQLYDMAEAQRLSRVARQRALNEFMAWSVAYGPDSLWGPPLGGPPARQPIGYESKQVGPNKWIYRPLYADDQAPLDGAAGEAPAANDLPAPQSGLKTVPRLPAPSDAGPGDFVPPRTDANKPAPGGPREF